MNFQWTTDLTSPTYNDALTIRKNVFIEGQKVDPAIEIDQLENQTLHLVGYLADKPAATARIYPVDAETYKVQRVAVLEEYRGQQLGAQLMLEIERSAKESKVRSLVLGAQDHAIAFYEKLGYQTDGPGFIEANIPHHHMKKSLS